MSLSLRLGAAYDWVLAGAILLALPGVLRALHFPAPADLFLFRLAAFPPLFFPLVYLTAAADPLGRPWAVWLSILLRSLGGMVLGLLAVVHQPPGIWLYLTVAALDMGWALVHWGLWQAKKNPPAQGDASG